MTKEKLFWQKKIETTELITYEGEKIFDERTYKFFIHFRNDKLYSIEVRHLHKGEIDYSTKSVKFDDLIDLEKFIEMLGWIKEETRRHLNEN